MNTFCTIVTSDFIHYAKALYESLLQFDTEVKLQVLVVDQRTEFTIEKELKGLNIHQVDEIGTEHAKKVKRKYYQELRGVYRWAMKSVFTSYLLNNYEKVIFLDPDIHFYQDPAFLFDLLEEHHVLLTPHWRVADARVFKNDMIRMYDHGIHNAGFVAASKEGRPAMDWWAEACLFSCEKDERNGQWDDQTYLSAMHLFFDKVYTLKHMGCNVAHWNFRYNKRVIMNEKVLVGGKDPIVFIHFDPDTIKHIENGKEDYLMPYLDQYRNRVNKNKKSYILSEN